MPTLDELDDRVTRIEFAFAQLKWAFEDATEAERDALPSCSFSPDQVEKILCLLGRFAHVMSTFSNPDISTINCPGPRCKVTEDDYQAYKALGSSATAT